MTARGDPYDVIVAGVGAMGSSAAWALARRGARVLGLDRSSIPNDQGSSGGVNRIIRLGYAEDPRHIPLLRRAYELWRETEQLSGERLLYITGGIDAGRPDGRSVTGALESCRTHGIPHELLSARALEARFPGIVLPDGMAAVYQADAGFVLSDKAIATYAALALGAGAELHGHERVIGWERDPAGVAVHTERGSYRAARLIVSAGAWTSTLVPALVGLAVPERQVLIWTQPRVPEQYALGRFPIFILDVDEGNFYGFPVFGIPGVKVGLYHHRGQVIDPDAWERGIQPGDEDVLRAGIARYLPGANGPTLTLRTCMFTNTPDERFIIDTLPDAPEVIVASPCSGHGFKFASVLGDVLADLALSGATRHDIAMFRLDRFH